MSEPTDFNDLAQLAGKDAVKAVVDQALAAVVDPAARDDEPPAWATDSGPMAGLPVKPPATGKAADENPMAPPQMRPEGFVPLLKEISDAACEHSEAHPVAVATNVLLFFCAMVGRSAFQRIGDAVIHCRLFAIIAGRTGKGRKGTAEALVRKLFSVVCADVGKRLNSPAKLHIHAGGLSTGEGIAWAIRDSREADDKGKGADEGVSDKRLLVIEAEFANMLSHCRREGNTLSATVRNLWDGRDLEPLTKSATTRASRPHVVIGGHITGQELREKATEGDAANGLLNRFMTLFVYRPKLVALPLPTRASSVDWLARRLTGAVIAATGGNLEGNCTREVTMCDSAEELWCELYPKLTRDREGKIGSLLARTDVYARMLAMVFALLDSRDEIEPCDLLAAVAWVDYWADSVAYIFRTGDGDDDQLTEFEVQVYELIRSSPGIKLVDIQANWNRHKTKEVKSALERLSSQAPPLVIAKKEDRASGRAALCYFPSD